MITINQTLNSSLSYSIEAPHALEDIMFFDIETTGFSPNTSYVYLIGCMYYKDKSWQLVQWLSDGIESEKDILDAFSSMIKGYKRLLHYNGSGFDIPYLLNKFKHYGFINPFLKLESFDIYKKLLPHKRLLPIKSLKLSEIEYFVGFKRRDTYTGGDLITVYTNFIGRMQYEKLKAKSNRNTSSLEENISTSNPTTEELSRILLLHNAEDIEGLLQVVSLLKYVDIIENPPIHKDVTSSLQDSYLKLETKLPYSVSCPLNFSLALKSYQSKKNESNAHPYYDLSLHMTIQENYILIYIPLISGELKYFYKDYKEYYYLPLEDVAIHKSVAEYVDKEYRMKAKPNTCYSKKKGLFIPFFTLKSNDSVTDTDGIHFYINYQDKIMFLPLELDDKGHLVDDKSISWQDYILHLLATIFQNKFTILEDTDK